MTTKFSMTRDINGYNGFGLQFSDNNYSTTLTAATPTTITVPSNGSMGGAATYVNDYWLALFNYTPGASVWVADNATSAVPAGATFASTTSTLNPAGRLVKGGDVLSFITAGTAVDVSVTLYSLT